VAIEQFYLEQIIIRYFEHYEDAFMRNNRMCPKCRAKITQGNYCLACADRKCLSYEYWTSYGRRDGSIPEEGFHYVVVVRLDNNQVHRKYIQASTLWG